MKVAIVNYGMGNIYSIQSALNYLGCKSVYTDKYEELSNSSHIILPGVGSFKVAMNYLKNRNLDKFLQQLILHDKKPLLGICLGMQLLGISSTEDGYSEGLGFVDAINERFYNDNKEIKIPHVGFNTVEKIKVSSVLLKGLKEKSDFYFTHSYRMLCKDDTCSGQSCNGENFVACVEKNNIFGVQFHPEKSQANGLRLLTNFLEYL